MAKKWRELTSIEDYEFDPEGKYDGSLYKEDWDEIFNDLYQRAETTEEYLDNQWVAPLSTRNAYTEYFKKGGHDYIVLKYYDGMYALYEIRDENKIDELNKRSVASCVIEKLDMGVSVRQAIVEAITGQNGLFEDIVGMDQETNDQLLNLMNKWIGGSGKGGWEYNSDKIDGGKFAIHVTRNPIQSFDEPVDLELNGSILNGEVYYKPADEYIAASAPVSFSGLKSIIRDLTSQLEMVQSDEGSESNSSGDILGY